ncbi:MAG: hypothetical protein ACD_15C00163G0002 [uncultured bacterium]|nr:MAG: hypothetical protein ACD_15C00163G0002 [uncultured bacterium]
MKSHIHLATNTSIALVAQPFVDVNLVNSIIFIMWGGLLIDVDHPLLFALKYKIFDPRGWMELARSLYEKQQAELYIFHSPEIHLVLAVLSFIYPFFFLVLASSWVHIVLDMIGHYRYHRNFQFLKDWSIIYFIWNLEKTTR